MTINEQISILLVEDEQNLHETLKLNLELEGYRIVSAYDGAVATKLINEEYFDLIIMDIMLPEVDGITIIEQMRMKNINIPVLILSARSSSTDRVLGLKKGADDYLTKPFNLEELLLRVKKILNRKQSSQTETSKLNDYRFGRNTIDFKAHEAVIKSGQKVKLTQKETMLLKLLIENKNEVISRERILQLVWGYNVYPTTRTIDNMILTFRKYFEENTRQPKYFQSIRGVGYKFAD